MEDEVLLTSYGFDWDDYTAGHEIRDGYSVRTIKHALDPLGIEYRISTMNGFIVDDYIDPGTLDVVIPNAELRCHGVSASINTKQGEDPVGQFIDPSSITVRVPASEAFWVIEMKEKDAKVVARALIEYECANRRSSA